MKEMSRYHKSQMEAIHATFEACEKLDRRSKDLLKDMIFPYMEFRKELQNFNERYFVDYCKRVCFQTARSACCSYESIIVFFADEVINYLFGGRDDFPVILERLNRVVSADRCVYLGKNGCLWTVTPISCAMFFCDDAKKAVFSTFPEAQLKWNELLRREKSFTWPDQPVLFDLIEEFFIKLGINTAHMYCHKSPGLLKVKADNKQKFSSYKI